MAGQSWAKYIIEISECQSEISRKNLEEYAYKMMEGKLPKLKDLLDESE
jgi:hypothetical protein